MASSIFNSRQAALIHSISLIAICVVLSSTLETASNYLLKHHSETYDRVSQQYADAVKVRPGKPGAPLPILMVGNSLLLDGIDLNRLHELTSPRMQIHPVFLEATGYYDWFYGLERLFREGSKPKVVVVGVGVNPFVANTVRQEYVPLMLFDLHDSLRVASDLQMDRTATSNLVLAHSSVFWDTRSVIRTQILRRFIPGYRELIALLKPPPVASAPEEFAATLNERVRRLRELCEAHGAGLILLVPPTPSSAELVRQMTRISHDLGVDTLVPLDPEMLSPTYYQPDELHLNSEGAALFTAALADALPRTVARQHMFSSQLARESEIPGGRSGQINRQRTEEYRERSALP
jgi:hypothetical protein